MTATTSITPATAPPIISRGSGVEESLDDVADDGGADGGAETAKVGEGEGRGVGGRVYSTTVTAMLSCITEIELRDAAVSTVMFAMDKFKIEAMDVKVLKKLVLLLVFKAAIRSFEKVKTSFVAKDVAAAVLLVDVL